MLSYTKFINEHKFSYLKKINPLNMGKVESSSVIPKEGGCALILTTPYKDGLKRVFLGIIDRVRGNREVNFLTDFYIIKEYPGGIIWGDKAGDIRKVLNMKSTGLTLNQNKTPFWEISCVLNRNEFFRKNQTLLKELLNREDIFVIKSDKKLPND